MLENLCRKRSGIVIAVEHAGAKQEHRVVEQSARAFLDGVELARDVGDLFEEELVHLEPVRRVAVREQVVNHVIYAEVRKPQRAMVVVQL